MVRNGEHDNLEDWLSEAEDSLLASLARGLNADRHAVLAALREPWFNGQTEGQINKLKALKRQMYGRASLDLLQSTPRPPPPDETSSKVSQTQALTLQNPAGSTACGADRRRNHAPSNNEADLRAFEPIPCPEIGPGVAFNANFCRNPMSPDFGPVPDLNSYAKRSTPCRP